MNQTSWSESSPFRWNATSDSFFQTPMRQEALARLEFLVGQHRRLGLLVGPSGSGKSLVLDLYAQHLRRQARAVAQFSLLDVEPSEMLWRLASAWGVTPDTHWSTSRLWRAIEDRLFEYRCQQIEAVVLLDDADQANLQAWQHVARLVRFDPTGQTWLTVVLAGRNEGMAHLGESLLDLAELRIDLEPWQRDETQEYVAKMLSRSGRKTPTFDAPAIDRLHELAQGNPRRVSQLADLALLAGAGQQSERIDADVVETAYRELGVGV